MCSWPLCKGSDRSRSARSLTRLARSLRAVGWALKNPAVDRCQVDLWSELPAAAHERPGSLRESLVADGFGAIGSWTLGLWTLDSRR